MDNTLLYNMIFKRKSFHLFRGVEGNITDKELEDIKNTYSNLIPLYPDIKTTIEIVKESETTCSRGGEYCILIYSEVKDNYLQNIGYIGEQLDLYLASMDIGALWFGIGKVEKQTIGNMQYVIMFSIAKMPKDKFRRDMFKAKRKTLDAVYSGGSLSDILNIARFSPSACNSQPWYVKDIDGKISIYRYKKQGKRGIMPADKVVYYNSIDIGIFMLIFEVCLKHENIAFSKTMYVDTMELEKELTLVAEYTLN